jgi:hypothetical protein
MDPDANIEQQIDLASRIIFQYENDLDEEISEEAFELAEHVISLDDWLVKEGFLPKRWRK